MPEQPTPGDLFFEKYCELNGYAWDWQPTCNGSPPLDYLVDRAGDRAVVEVKYFTTRWQHEKLKTMPGKAMFMQSTVPNLQSRIRRGGEQLKPCARLGLPLVVVLTTPVETDVDLDSDDMVAALLGKTEYDLDLDAMIYSGKGAAVLHRDETGQSINRLPHLSAVVALYGMLEFPRADVYDLAGTVGFTGTPLPRSLFDAEDDVRLGWLGSERFGRLRAR